MAVVPVWSVIVLSWWSCCCQVPAAADPGRDLCKIYNEGLKCSSVSSYFFPYDLISSFNDDLARFTTDMKYLEIVNGNVSLLQSRSFQQTPYLSHLILSNVSLTEIEQGAFAGLKRLKLVDLSDNLIPSIPVDLFKHTKINRLNLGGNRRLEMPKNGPILSAKYLSSLSLRNCQIRRLSPSTFGELPALVNLDLSQNLMNALPPNLFSTLKHLTHLDLSGNEFSNLDVTVFESMYYFPRFPVSVILSNNPWVCDCRIRQLSAWVTTSWKTDEWTEVPENSRLRKPVTCLGSNEQQLTWNSREFKALMSTC